MRPLYFLLFVLSIQASSATAQVFDGDPMDSATVTFDSGSLTNFIPDTAAIPLWQIGHSRKVFFGVDSTGTPTIMTDTINMYPTNANNFFVLKIPHTSWNVIIDFWHRYQTDSGRDGGAVEYSVDAGATWQNVKGLCNVDLLGGEPGIHTDNFYSATDTLADGTSSFNGISASTRYSRLQFFEGVPIRATAGAGCSWSFDTVYIRFIFKSDSSADSLAGWQIDSIKIEHDKYTGLVTQNRKPMELKTYPNPAYDGQFTFPALDDEQDAKIEVYNSVGYKILERQYSRSLDLSPYSKGLYFYRVTEGVYNYSGYLLTE